MTEPLKTFRERAKLRLEDRERFTVDNGKVAVCEHCGSVYYRVKKEDISVEQDAQRVK